MNSLTPGEETMIGVLARQVKEKLAQTYPRFASRLQIR